MSFLLRIYPRRRMRSKPSFEQETPLHDYAKVHVVSGDDPNVETYRYEHIPLSRSGHRIFTTTDYLYCIGGYDAPNGNGAVYKEVWRMNLLTKQWNKMEFENLSEFPETLASFAICQVAPFSNQVVFFGGTSTPFGLLSGDTPYILTMLSNGKVHSEKLDIPNPPRGVYGHAMVRSPTDSKYYIVGGTTGHNFFLDINCLSLVKKEPNCHWKWEKMAEWHGTGSGQDPPGLYRLECVIDGKMMLFFGGGTPDYVQRFDKMYCYDFEDRRFKTVNTKGDPNMEGSRFPTPRRCHSATQFGRKVIVAGGCGIDTFNDRGERMNEIYGDIWVFDLDTYQWTKHPSEMSIAVFFHSAAVTQDGCLFIHGGVSVETSKLRSNTLQAFWISPPNLLHWASRVILKEVRRNRIYKPKSKKFCDQSKTISLEDLVISRTDSLYNLVVGPPA